MLRHRTPSYRAERRWRDRANPRDFDPNSMFICHRAATHDFALAGGRLRHITDITDACCVVSIHDADYIVDHPFLGGRKVVRSGDRYLTPIELTLDPTGTVVVKIEPAAHLIGRLD